MRLDKTPTVLRPLVRPAAPFVLLLALPLLLTAAACDAETREIQIPGPSGPIASTVTLPPDFDPETAYAVLAGPGDYYWQDSPSQPGWITVTSEGFWGDGHLERSRAVLDWIAESYRVRGDRVHLACWSANSAGVFEIAMAHPDRVASVTGVAGMPGRGSEADLAKLKEVRVQFIVGDRDTYWRDGSKRWHEKLLEAGVHSTLEIIPNGEHVMGELVNDPFFERMNRLLTE